ncbi:MAG: 50S ribosomal protein L35 [Acidobacteriota bacterium]
MKLKTKRAAAKRFKVTGSGKIVKRGSHHSHILTKKSSKRKRGLNRWSLLSDPDQKRAKAMLNLG